MKDLVKRLNDMAAGCESYSGSKLSALLREAAKALSPEPELRKDQDVIVSDYSDFSKSTKRKYSHKEDGKHYCFRNGGSSYNQEDTMWWYFCKPDYDAPTLPNWIPNTGVAPDVDLNKVVCELRNGCRVIGENILTWDIRDCVSDVIKYCIIDS